MACRSRQPGLLAPQIRRNGIAAQERGEKERGSSHPLRAPPPPPSPPPPPPSGEVCWVRSRQFGLNNHRPFLHQRRHSALLCHAHRYGDLKMAGMLMQIALPSFLLRRQFRATLVVNDCVCGSLQDGWSHFEHDTIKSRQLCGNQRCCCPSTFFVSLCDAARQSIASLVCASVRPARREFIIFLARGREREEGRSFVCVPSARPYPHLCHA